MLMRILENRLQCGALLASLSLSTLAGCSDDQKEQVTDPRNRLPEDKISCVCSGCFFCKTDNPNDENCPEAQRQPIQLPIAGDDCVTANDCQFSMTEVQMACLDGCKNKNKVIASCDTIKAENSVNPSQICTPLGCTGGVSSTGQPLTSSPYAFQSVVDVRATLQSSSRVDLTFQGHTSGSTSSGLLSARLCNNPPCEMSLDRVDLLAAPITFEDCVLFVCDSATIFGLSAINRDSVRAVLQPDGSFEVDSSTANFFSTFNIDGDTPGSTEVTPVSAPTGHVDLAAGTITLNGQWRGLPGSGYADLRIDTTLSAAFAGSPLIVDAGADQTVECDGNQSAHVTLSGAQSVGATSFFWHEVAPRRKVGEGSPLQTTLALGSHQIELRALSTAGAADLDTVTIQVVDTTQPTFDAHADAYSISLCDPGSELALLVVPTARDVCLGVLPVSGQIIESNGVAQNKPIVDGKVSLEPGIHRVRWQATDDAGNSSSIEQVIDLRPSIWADDTLDFGNRAQALAPSGFALVANRGRTLTRIGVESEVGDLFSVASVDLRNRAKVHGRVLSAGSVHVGNGALVTEPPFVENGTVNLPPAPTVLTAFPPPTQDVSVAPDTTQPLAPGSYGSVTVFPRASLVLSVGTYFFGSLDVQPQAEVQVPSQTAPTINVQSSLILHGRFLRSSTQLGQVTLNYAGTAAVVLEAEFFGRFFAPSASVAMGTGDARNFTGEFFAKQLEVRPDSVLRCGALAPPTVLGESWRGALSHEPSLSNEPSPKQSSGCSVSRAAGGAASAGSLLLACISLLPLVRRRRQRRA